MWRNCPTPETHHEYVGVASRVYMDAWDEKSYTEGFMRGHLIRAIWVKKWARDYYSAARHIAAVLGVNLLYVEDGAERIWERFPAEDSVDSRF